MGVAPCDLVYILLCSSLLLSSPLFLGWGSFRGPEVTSFSLTRQQTPQRASLFVTWFCPSFFSASLLLCLLHKPSLSPPPHPTHPPVPRGLAAVLNAQKRKAFTYIILAVQLMSWCVSAVWWCQSCLERQRACWVGQCVKSYSCTERGEKGDRSICPCDNCELPGWCWCYKLQFCQQPVIKLTFMLIYSQFCVREAAINQSSWEITILECTNFWNIYICCRLVSDEPGYCHLNLVIKVK